MPVYYQLVEDIIENKKAFDIYNILNVTTTKTLIIHSKQDTTVSYKETEKVAKNDLVTIDLMDQGSHTFDGVHPYIDNKLPLSTEDAIQKSIAFLKNKDL